MDSLDGIDFYRLRSTPRRPRESEQQDPVPAHLFAALTAVHSDLSVAPDDQGLLAVAWQRLPGDPSVRILVGGRPSFTPARPVAGVGDVVPVLFPPGSHAEFVDTGDVLDTWAKFPAWIRCVGQSDALWTPTRTSTRPPLRGGFDDYIAHLGEAFVWLTLAQPLPPDDIDAELDELNTRIPLLRRRENSETSRVELARAQGRFRELSRARAGGLWSVRVLVGGDTPAAARRAAALLCSSSDLDDQPYTLVPDSQSLSFADGVDAASAFTTVSELVAVLARPPKRELPGIRLVERAEFDLTPETAGPIHLGDVLDDADQPAVPYGLNPLRPEPGFPLQTHIDLVRALFLAAFELIEPFPQVLSQALDRCYRDLGWDPTISASHLAGVTPRYPHLGDLHRTALAVVDGIGYGQEVADNVRGFVDVRIRSLQMGTPGRFFDCRYPLDIADLLRRDVVLEIEDIGTDTDKAFLIGAVLIRIVEHLRVSSRSAGTPRLRHVTVVEEAHRLLKRTEPGTSTAHAIELFTALLAEVRGYGEGIVIAEQIPDKIVPDVIKNTAFKIVHRLPAAEDRAAVGATMNLDDTQSRHVVSLPPGRAAAFTDGMDRPIRVTVPYGEAREFPPTATAAPRITASENDRGVLLTARQLAHAEHLATDPRLMLWLELLTAAHLVGRPAPDPDGDWLDHLTASHPRLILDHAITHRIQLAIDGRYVGLAAYYQPETLAAHLVKVAQHTLDGTASPCDGSETRWQACQYRWADVAAALNNSTVPPDQPHPDTSAWARRGLRLAGNTISEQLHALYAHPDSWRPDPSIITGTPSVYDQALTALSPAPDPEQRLIDAAGHLGLTTTWPVIAFTPTEAHHHDHGRIPRVRQAVQDHRA